MTTTTPVTPDSPGAPLRVLVAEDDEAAAAAIAELLRRHGHQPRVAHDGLHALCTAQADPPDVALLDLGLPGLDGYRLAERLREVCGPRRPLLVAVTGRGADLDRVMSSEAGIDLHLVKPVDPDEIVAILRRFRPLVRPEAGEAG
jgi:DNA-binding response OmpR family regulator